MISAAFFLITRNLKNRVVRSVLRLRQPRYIAGAAVAILYFWSMFFRKAAINDIRHLQHGPVNQLMIVVASSIVLLLLIGAWAIPSDEPGLIFSEAEIQFFFAGPVSRPQLIAYKIFRSQVQSVFSAIIFSFFAFRGSHFVGMWLVLTILDMYRIFASFGRARLKQLGIGFLPRLVGVLAVLAIAGFLANRQFGAEAASIKGALQGPKSDALFTKIASIAAAPPLGTILFLPGLFGRTLYAPAPFLPAALLVMFGAVCFFLTTQLDVAFEDASIVASQRALTRRARRRGMRGGPSGITVRNVRPLFPLAERGRPEVALLWKNLVGTMRLSAFPVLLIAIPLAFAAGISIFGRHDGIPDALGIMGLMLSGAFVFLGPLAIRMDLRTDILRMDVIKAYPLPAEMLVAAELAAPLLVISAFELVTLLASVIAMQFGAHYFEFFTTPEFVVCAFVFVVPVVAIQLLIQNGAVLLFPAWNMTSDNRGFSAMGQRLLLLGGNAITLTIALIPAAIVFAPSLWIVRRLFGSAPFGILAATIPAVAVLGAEIFVAHKLLAAQFEEIDIANDIEAVTE